MQTYDMESHNSAIYLLESLLQHENATRLGCAENNSCLTHKHINSMATQYRVMIRKCISSVERTRVSDYPYRVVDYF